MRHLKLDAGLCKRVCNLLEYLGLRCSCFERRHPGPTVIVHDLNRISRLKEYKLCLETNEELYVEFLFRISIRIASLANITR